MYENKFEGNEGLTYKLYLIVQYDDFRAWCFLAPGKFSDGGAKVSFLCKKTFSEKENIHSSRE